MKNPLSESHASAAVAVAAVLGFSCVTTQLVVLRESLSAFSGNEMVLGLVLGLWLLLTGLGSWLGRFGQRLVDLFRALALLQIAVALLPLCQVFLLRAGRNAVFVRGAAVGVTGVALAELVLLLPYCLVSGCVLTLACLVLGRRDGPTGAGRVYVADALGSIAGGILFTFGLSHVLDHLAILFVPASLNLLAAALVAGLGRPRWLAIACLVLGLGLGATGMVTNLDAWSTALQYRPQHIVAKANSPYGRLVVTEAAGQLALFENGVPVACTRDDQHIEETVHFALAQRPDARKVLLIGGGFSGTAQEILRYKAGQVDYVELDPALLELGAKCFPQALNDPRIRVHTTDGRLFVKQTRDAYDVVILDVPAPATVQLNRFYTTEFFREVHRVLAPGGVLSFALGQYENFVSPELARLLASARSSLATSFRNTLALPGSHVFLLASDGPLRPDVAELLAQRSMKTRFVNRHYLDAMFAPDRMADLERALNQAAAANHDFSPMLYYYYLRHWLSQFDNRLGLICAVAGVALIFWFIRLRGCAVPLLVSGFAASALELVLLLGFQVICGSVYHQVGVIVTLFMVGLASGAWLVNRCSPSGYKALGLLALAIAGFAFCLPTLLPLLARFGATTATLGLSRAALALLALLLAFLVGLQFPLANQLEFDGTARSASRLYTADFLGASLGALLACTLLVPLMGIKGLCWLTAGFNLLAGAFIFFRRTVT